MEHLETDCHRRPKMSCHTLHSCQVSWLKLQLGEVLTFLACASSGNTLDCLVLLSCLGHKAIGAVKDFQPAWLYLSYPLSGNLVFNPLPKSSLPSFVSWMFDSCVIVVAASLTFPRDRVCLISFFTFLSPLYSSRPSFANYMVSEAHLFCYPLLLRAIPSSSVM